MSQHESNPMWWQGMRDPVQLALEIPVTNDDGRKKERVTRGFWLILGAIVLRIIGLAIAGATLAYGGYTFYQIPKNLSMTPIVKIIAQGFFLCFLGLLTLAAETRTRRTMHGCMDTYVLFSSYLARGLIYCVLGAIIFALKSEPPYIPKWYLAGGIVAGGLLNLIYYPFYWKYERRKAVSEMHSVPLEPYPEEIIYGMDTQYIKNGEVHPATPLLAFNPAAERSDEVASSASASSASSTPSIVGADHQINKVKASGDLKRFSRDNVTRSGEQPVFEIGA